MFSPCNHVEDIACTFVRVLMIFSRCGGGGTLFSRLCVPFCLCHVIYVCVCVICRPISQGKTGITITGQADRKDKDAYTGKSKNNLFDHSDGFQLSEGETGEYYVTLNELVYKAPNEDKTRTVSQHLWMGSKFNDLEVERKSERQPVRTSMRRARIDDMKHTKPADAFRTHSNEVAEASIKIGHSMSEDGETVRSKQILPMAEGGQRAQIGRKAVGDCARSLDASYRNIGLRR